MKFIFCFLLITNYYILKCESNSEVKQNKELHSIVYFSVGGALANTSYDFFETYNSVLGGSNTYFNNSPILGIGSKFDIKPNFKLGIGVELIKSNLNDTYFQEVSTIDYAGGRFVIDKLNLNSGSLIASIEYIPYKDWQFKTYVGAGAGFTFTQIFWDETVKSGIRNDFRVTGEYYDDSHLSPTLRLLMGLDLGFDEDFKRAFLGSLILEMRFTYTHRNIDIFSTFQKVYPYEVPEFNKNYLLQSTHLSLNLMVSFNFVHNLIQN